MCSCYECANRRGINLIPTVYKLLASANLLRLHNKREEQTREEQTKFRIRRGCVDQILPREPLRIPKAKDRVHKHSLSFRLHFAYTTKPLFVEERISFCVSSSKSCILLSQIKFGPMANFRHSWSSTVEFDKATLYRHFLSTSPQMFYRTANLVYWTMEWNSYQETVFNFGYVNNIALLSDDAEAVEHALDWGNHSVSLSMAGIRIVYTCLLYAFSCSWVKLKDAMRRPDAEV